jgi:hypothetical protein
MPRQAPHSIALHQYSRETDWIQEQKEAHSCLRSVALHLAVQRAVSFLAIPAKERRSDLAKEALLGMEWNGDRKPQCHMWHEGRVPGQQAEAPHPCLDRASSKAVARLYTAAVLPTMTREGHGYSAARVGGRLEKKMAREHGGDVNILATDFQVVIRWSHTVNNVSEKKMLCHVVVSMRSASYRFQCNVRGVVVK